MSDDVLRRLRTATAVDHRRVEAALDLVDPHLDRPRLVAAMTALHAFWRVAEEGLDAWSARRPADAADVQWDRRRRGHLYAEDLRALGAAPAPGGPVLAEVRDTDEALGRMYVLEGSTLGGTVIDRHLAALPALAGVRLRAFAPYGPDAGAMWAAYRRATREHVATDGDADRVVAAARSTFAALSEWVATEHSGDRHATVARELWTSR